MADRLVLEMMGEDMKMFDVEQVKALNDLERMVYEYVVKDPEKVKYMRIRELADEVHVSTSTILRFCKKMGCSGYSEFKLQLRDYQTRKDQANVREAAVCRGSWQNMERGIFQVWVNSACILMNRTILQRAVF